MGAGRVGWFSGLRRRVVGGVKVVGASVLDLLGLALVVAGAGVLFGVGVALVFTGCALLLVSWAATRRRSERVQGSEVE